MRLQGYYPINEEQDENEKWCRLNAMTVEELDWNIQRIRKAANVELKHADDLEEYRNKKAPQAA